MNTKTTTTYMNKLHIISTLLLFLLFGTIHKTYAQSSDNKCIRQVKAILQKQAEHWNRGDIDAFMQYYWKSDKLQFIGSRGVTYGWQQTLDNYKKGYPDKATMGTLTFDILDVNQLSRKVIMLTGKFLLKRENMDDAQGHFLLIWKKIKGKWRIIADHTS